MSRLYAVLLALIFVASAGGCDKSGKPMTEEDVFSLVNDRLDALNTAAEEICAMDEYVSLIGFGKYFDDIPELDGIDGLFNSGLMSGKRFYASMSNDNLEKLLSDGEIRFITVYPEGSRETCEFPCGEKTESEEYGFYYSKDDVALYRGTEVDFTEEQGVFTYQPSEKSLFTTKKITDCWYYYRIDYTS